MTVLWRYICHLLQLQLSSLDSIMILMVCDRSVTLLAPRSEISLCHVADTWKHLSPASAVVSGTQSGRVESSSTFPITQIVCCRPPQMPGTNVSICLRCDADRSLIMVPKLNQALLFHLGQSTLVSSYSN